MWKTGGPVFPLKRGLMSGRASDPKTNAMSQKCRYLQLRPLIGNKPKEKEERRRSRSEIGFAIQVDESTDVTNCAQLQNFVRYVRKEDVKEEFLRNAALEATTREDDIFQMVNSFFKQHGLRWENLRGCTTDEAQLF